MVGLNDDRGGGLATIESARDEAGVLVVKLTGEVDISNAEPIGETLEILVGSDARTLVVDLAALDFMDSAGIAMLLRAAARVDSVEIRNPSSVMRRIIECTGLSGIFHISG
jgi:anti-sigma B factor antagonist